MNYVDPLTPPLPAPPLSYWVYISSAAPSFRPEDIQRLLEKSRLNNARLGLTGMLLYKEGQFLQMLEGPETVVQEMAAKISHDARHCSIVSLIRANEAQRLFPASWMGFAGFEDVSPEQRTRIDALLQSATVASEDIDPKIGTHPARLLMQTFACHM